MLLSKIIILNGAARKNGNTAKLVQAFEGGAISAGKQVKTAAQVALRFLSPQGIVVIPKSTHIDWMKEK